MRRRVSRPQRRLTIKINSTLRFHVVAVDCTAEPGRCKEISPRSYFERIRIRTHARQANELNGDYTATF